MVNGTHAPTTHTKTSKSTHTHYNTHTHTQTEHLVGSADRIGTWPHTSSRPGGYGPCVAASCAVCWPCSGCCCCAATDRAPCVIAAAVPWPCGAQAVETGSLQHAQRWHVAQHTGYEEGDCHHAQHHDRRLVKHVRCRNKCSSNDGTQAQTTGAKAKSISSSSAEGVCRRRGCDGDVMGWGNRL